MLLSLVSKRSLEIDSRDTYGFALRPQHVQKYREYASIYQEEEGERSDKWRNFLEQISSSSQLCSSEIEIKKDPDRITEGDNSSRRDSAKGNEKKEHVSPEGADDSDGTKSVEGNERKEGISPEIVCEGDDLTGRKSAVATEVKEEEISLERLAEGDSSSCKKSVTNGLKGSSSEKEVHCLEERKTLKVAFWAEIRPSLFNIDKIMSARVKKGKIMKGKLLNGNNNHLPSIQESESVKGVHEEDCKDDVCTNKTLDNSIDASSAENAFEDQDSSEHFFPWRELEFLVQGGVPKDIRGEVWQAFVGVKTRRVESYYENLLAQEICSGESKEQDVQSGAFGKWRKQIEKDIPRTFPGHPALDENGRNSLRRLLLAYARHNPSVGYCQAMNFFAGLLLLLMPEENAFWALVGIIDDYFGGCYTEEMIESQVDQLVFEELVRERFPKLVSHLDYLGVQVTWISGPWFLSIFVNLLPWDSVLRVWDVLLFEGNRVMLFRTALALMELYGSSLVTTKDAGDALTLLQSLAGSTFDSSQLVFSACMGFLAVTEARLQELRDKHRSSVLVVVEERSKGPVSKESKGIASKLHSFKRKPEPLVEERKTTDKDKSQLESQGMLNSINAGSEGDSLADLQEQVVWFKAEVCRLLEEKRSSVLRAEELETALMEMVNQDDRLELTTKVKQLEHEVAELQLVIAAKKEQEDTMLQVLMRVEQEQKVTEDALRKAEQDANNQKYEVRVLREKYNKAMELIAEMEKRLLGPESSLQATIEFQSGQSGALSSPRAGFLQSPREEKPSRKTSLLNFGLGWREKSKGKPTSVEESSESKPNRGGTNAVNEFHNQEQD